MLDVEKPSALNELSLEPALRRDEPNPTVVLRSVKDTKATVTPEFQ